MSADAKHCSVAFMKHVLPRLRRPVIPYGLTSMLATAGAIASVESIGPSVSARASVAGLPAPDRASRWLGIGGMGGGEAIAGASAGVMTLGRSRLAGIGGIGGACRDVDALAGPLAGPLAEALDVALAEILDVALAEALDVALAEAVVGALAEALGEAVAEAFRAALSLEGVGVGKSPVAGGRPVVDSPGLPTAAGVELPLIPWLAVGGTGATLGQFAIGATGATTGASGGRLTTVAVAEAGTADKDGDGEAGGTLQSLLAVAAAGLTTRRGSMKW